MAHPIPMNVWPSRPSPVTPTEWRALAHTRTLTTLSYQALCNLAGVPLRVSGPDLERRVHILSGEQHAYPVGSPDQLGVAFPDYRGTQRDALRVLEILAYGYLDYAAREAVRDRGLFVPVAPRGRKATGKASSSAERMRRLRLRARRKRPPAKRT